MKDASLSQSSISLSSSFSLTSFLNHPIQDTELDSSFTSKSICLPTLECIPNHLDKFIECAHYLNLLFLPESTTSCLTTSNDMNFFNSLYTLNTNNNKYSTKLKEAHHPNVFTLKSNLMQYIYFVLKYSEVMDHLLMEVEFFMLHSKWTSQVWLIKLFLFTLILVEFNPFIFTSKFGLLWNPVALDSNAKDPSPIFDIASSATKFHASWARLRILKQVYGPSYLNQMHQFVSWPMESKDTFIYFQLRHLDLESFCLTFQLPQEKIKPTTFPSFSFFLKDSSSKKKWNELPSSLFLAIPRDYGLQLIDSVFFRETRQLVFMDYPTQVLLHLITQLQTKETTNLSILESHVWSDTRLLYYKTYLPECNIKACTISSKLQVDYLVQDVLPVSFLSTSTDLNVQVILLEPENSLSTVLDYLSYIVQENRLPFCKIQLSNLIQQQKASLLHAMQFPTVNYILYVVRSLDPKETMDILHECCELQNMAFELVSLDPLRQEGCHGGDSAMFHPALSFTPSLMVSNGMFLALLQRRTPTFVSTFSSLNSNQGNPESQSESCNLESSAFIKKISEPMEPEEEAWVEHQHPLTKGGGGPEGLVFLKKKKKKRSSLTFLKKSKSNANSKDSNLTLFQLEPLKTSNQATPKHEFISSASSCFSSFPCSRSDVALNVYGTSVFKPTTRKVNSSFFKKSGYTSLPHLKPWK